MGKRLPIRIQPMFWLFAVLIGLLNTGFNVTGTIVWVIVILVSVLFHELGHALTAMAFKQKVRIQLMFFGGATYREGPRISLPKDFLVTLNGPVFGFILAAIAYGVLNLFPALPGVVAYGFKIMLFVNIFWSVVNLFPILPLDGGHLLRIILEGIFGAKGTSIALLVGVFLGAGVAVASFIFGAFLVGAIFALLTFESFRGWKMMRHSSEADRKEDLQELFRDAQEKAAAGQSDVALDEFEELRSSAGSGLLYNAATEAAAALLFQKDEVEKAYGYLKPLSKHLSPMTLPMFHQLALEMGDYDSAVKVGKEAYQINPGAKAAYLNALAHAGMEEVQPAIGWLKCALRDGMPNVTEALRGREFDRIRHTPQFEDFLKSLDGASQ